MTDLRPRYVRFLQTLAFVSAATGCGQPAPTQDSASTADAIVATDSTVADANAADSASTADAIVATDSTAAQDSAASSDATDPAADGAALGDALVFDVSVDGSDSSVAIGTCAADAGAVVSAPAGDGGTTCIPISGRACDRVGALACGGPGGATSFGCVCTATACGDDSGSVLRWLCGGGGALPPPELAA